MVDYVGWKPALTAALGKVGETLAVEQVTLNANLDYTLPTGTPAGVVHRVVFTQDGTGGHTVTYGPDTLAIDTDPGASTLVEIWPSGDVVYPGATGGGAGLDTEAVQDVVGAMVTAAGGSYNDGAGTITLPSGGGSSTITADDTPAAPAEGESASYLVTSAVSWPAGLVWSTDPDGGVAPTITGTALVSLFTVGGTTRAIMGATFPAAAAPADTTAPTWTATFTMGTPTSSSVVATASALATDDSGSVTYEVSYNNAATWAAIVPSGSNFTLAGSPSTTYATTKLRAKDAAGNTSTPVLSVPSYTMAASADVTSPTVGTMAASSITSSGFTLTVSGAADETALHAQPYAFTTDNGTTWSAYQTSNVYAATGKTAAAGYTCNWRVRDAAGNVSTGTAQTVTTSAAGDTTDPTWSATFTMGTPTSTSVVATASAMASDNVTVTGYEVSYNDGTSWAAITPSGSNFTLTGTASTTYATTKLRAKDAAGNTSKPVLSVPSYTMAAGADLYPDATIYDTFAGMTDGAKLVTEAGGVYTSNRNTEKGGLPWVLTPIPLYSPLKPAWLPAVTSGRVQGGQSSVPRVGMLSCAQTKVKVEMDYGVGANYGDRISIGVAGSATQNITARITNLGELRIYRDNGTQLGATISGVATTGKIGLSYDPATGAITVWIDDVQTHSATTTTGLTGTVSHFEFQGIDGWFDNVRVTYL